MNTVEIDVANFASDRYAASEAEIRRMKDSIRQNRKGQATLMDIQDTTDPARVAGRIEREGVPVDEAVERINGVPNFQDVVVLKRMLKLSEAVCRLIIRSPFGASGYGTGFLIAPNLIITNNHVFPDADVAKNSSAQFRYELAGNSASAPVTFRLRPDLFFMTSPIEKQITVPFSGLDFTIVAVENKSDEGVPISDFTPVRLDATAGKILNGENCVIIQHPGGDYKKIVLKDIRMITLTDNFLIYESDTLPGSSGSMVVGLGTAEIVALHHSGVPKRNAQGQWLRKDGTPVQPGDADNLIDWIGNEGIRISSILKAVRKIEIEKGMEPHRAQIFETATADTGNKTTSKKTKIESMETPLPDATALPVNGTVRHFEVELSAMEALQDDWKAQPQALLPGLLTSEPLFPYASDAAQRRFYYLTVQSDKDPWQLAAEIEALPHIESCTPDLPAYTDVGGVGINLGGMPTGQESAVRDFFYNDGTASPNETEFKERWRNAALCKEAIEKNALDAMRQWNRKAVNFSGPQANGIWTDIRKNLPLLKLVQLDTGYSNHSKVKDGYDLQSDRDFIDGDEDAKDEQAKVFFKFPNHGTRTASLVVGGNIKPAYEGEGNLGILHDNGKPLVKLTPYRIAKTVALLGRGREMVDGAYHAVANGADVMFMCMGSYPRPMMAEVARHVYESGVIWVCAAGNEVEMVVAPALYPGTIAVAAINPDQKPWSGTSYGEAVDIAAPGEAVYVPFTDKDGKEIMAYGNGTSYATPHVAAAAMLWRAKWHGVLKKYREKWQIVEAFRWCLQKSTSKPYDGWNEKQYGKGILNIDKLLETAPPDDPDACDFIVHAYKDKSASAKTDLGVREAVHFLWNTLRRKLTPGHQTEAAEFAGMTPRGRTALLALMKSKPAGVLESTALAAPSKNKKILEDYFESYRK